MLVLLPGYYYYYSFVHAWYYLELGVPAHVHVLEHSHVHPSYWAVVAYYCCNIQSHYSPLAPVLVLVLHCTRCEEGGRMMMDIDVHNCKKAWQEHPHHEDCNTSIDSHPCTVPELDHLEFDACCCCS